MNNQKYTDGDKSGLGCLALIALFALPSILSALFVALIPYFVVGAVGFGLYQLYLYNQRTGNIERYFERQLTGEEVQNALPLPDEQQALPAPQDDVLKELEELKQKQRDLEQQNEQLKTSQKADIQEALQRQEKKQNEKFLKGFFANDTSSYAKSDQHERTEFTKAQERQKTEMEMRAMRQEMRELNWQTEKTGYEGRLEIKQELGSFKEAVQNQFNKIYDSLRDLAGNVITLRAYVDTRFSQYETLFHQTIAQVNGRITELRSEIKEDVAGVRVEFGREIVRVDKAQMKIIGKMQEYEASIKKFTYDVMKIKVDAEKFATRGEHMLNRAHVVWQKHQNTMQMMGKELDMNLKEISLHKKDFANEVGQAKLTLDRISDEQYLALKEIGYEKVGVEMLRKDHTQRVQVEHARMQNLVQEKRHIEEKIRMNLNNDTKVNQLQHQLYMTQENLQHSRNRHSLLSQEQAVFQKLSRGY